MIKLIADSYHSSNGTSDVNSSALVHCIYVKTDSKKGEGVDKSPFLLNLLVVKFILSLSLSLSLILSLSLVHVRGNVHICMSYLRDIIS